MQISIPVNRKRVPTALLFYLGLTLLWAYWTLDTPFGGRLYQVLFGITLVMLFVRVIITLIDYMKTLFDASALLTIDDEGMTDHRSILSCGEIPWTTINRVDLVQRGRYKILLVRVDDPEKLIARQSLWKRLFLKEMRSRYGTPVIISQSAIAYDIHRLLEELQPRIAERAVF